MKRVLSFLLMIVFTQATVAPAFAKTGGPSIGGTQNVSATGTYAGVLIPQDDPTGATSPSNSIGLFSMGVPDAGIAQGACVVFVEGIAYNGNITGIVDPLVGRLVGIVDAISTFSVTDPAGNTFSPFAQGNVTAQIRETASFSPVALTVQTFSFATTRLEGRAELDVLGAIDAATGQPLRTNSVSFVVDGFKQSATVVISSLAITPGGGNAP